MVLVLDVHGKISSGGNGSQVLGRELEEVSGSWAGGAGEAGPWRGRHRTAWSLGKQPGRERSPGAVEAGVLVTLLILLDGEGCGGGA